MTQKVEFTIIGQPYSKANSRKKVNNPKTGKPMFIKSDKALSYEKSALLQLIPIRNNLFGFAWEDKLFKGEVFVSMHIYYASQRPDLDESIILDVMQGYIYKNDRQVRAKYVRFHLDKANPRAEISVEDLV